MIKTTIKKLVWAVCFVCICEGLYHLIDNPIIFPSPFSVLRIMIADLGQKEFYQITLVSIGRVLFGVFASLLLGILIAFLRFFHQNMSWIDRLILIFRSIPNVTLVILFLFWVDGEKSIFFVMFLVLFPIVYQACVDALYTIQKQWSAVFDIYPQPRSYMIKAIYVPMLGDTLRSVIVSISSLGFKVGVMAEILSQVRLGIGRSMQIAKLNIDIASLTAWTLWLLILIFLIEKGIKKGIDTIEKKKEKAYGEG